MDSGNTGKAFSFLIWTGTWIALILAWIGSKLLLLAKPFLSIADRSMKSANASYRSPLERGPSIPGHCAGNRLHFIRGFRLLRVSTNWKRAYSRDPPRRVLC